MSEAMVDGYPHRVWWDADGETVVESYTITDMAHGTPLGIADDDERYGAQGAFLIEAGISSSYHIASFFGLTEWIAQPQETSKETSKEASKEKNAAKEILQEPAPVASAASVMPKEPAKKIPSAIPAPVRTPDISTVLQPLAALNRRPEPQRR